MSQEPTSLSIDDVYQKYGYLVLRICREVLRQEQDAEDAMHETFLKFWRYIDKLQEPREIVAVLKRTAFSCAIDYLRSRDRQGKYREAWIDLKELTHSEQLQNKREQRFNREIVAILFRAVRIDDETLRMAYHYYMDDMTLEEVAQTTGFSRRSVGMKLERFRNNALKYCRNHQITW